MKAKRWRDFTTAPRVAGRNWKSPPYYGIGAAERLEPVKDA
jgi:hypothetical protein